MEKEEINKSWKNFSIFFWSGLLIDIVGSVSIFLSESGSLFLISTFISLPLLCGSLGYYAYKFSEKKRYILISVLGISIVGPLTAFIGYFFVLNFKKNREITLAQALNSIP